MKIIKQELQFEKCLKQRIEFICEFSKVTTTFINGSIRKLEKTNLTYIEPHKVIVKNITFLVFNYSNDVYISNKDSVKDICFTSWAMTTNETKELSKEKCNELNINYNLVSVYPWENIEEELDELNNS